MSLVVFTYLTYYCNDCVKSIFILKTFHVKIGLKLRKNLYLIEYNVIYMYYVFILFV